MMKSPGVSLIIIYSNPAVEYTNDHLEQKHGNQKGMGQPGSRVEFNSCNQPGKQKQIGGKKQMIQAVGFKRRKTKS